MAELAIRPAAAADASAIAALSTQLGYPSSEAVTLARMDALADRGTTAVLVATSEDSVVGWIAVREDLTLESGAFAEIAGLVVDEASRCRKFGEALVAAAEAWVKARGLTRIRVRSNVLRERAHGFYRRLGYSETKRQAVFDKTL